MDATKKALWRKISAGIKKSHPDNVCTGPLMDAGDFIKFHIQINKLDGYGYYSGCDYMDVTFDAVKNEVTDVNPYRNLTPRDCRYYAYMLAGIIGQKTNLPIYGHIFKMVNGRLELVKTEAQRLAEAGIVE